MERSYFFDSTENNIRTYQAADFARYHAQIVGNGVSNTPNLSDLSVSAKENMTVMIGAGYAFANGYMYENTAALDLIHDSAEPEMDRIDRVVIRFDNTPGIRAINAYIKKGVPASSPVPPGLLRDSLVYELSIAQVLIESGKSFIEQYQIADERTNDNVCGYIPLHNIYRGMNVNQDGIVTMQNQSYVDSRNSIANYYLPSIPNGGSSSESLELPWLGNPSIDRQGEVNGKYFTPKADGVYHLWLMIRTDSFMPADHVGADVQFHLAKNGVPYGYPFISRAPASRTDNIWIGSVVEQIDAGDQISIFGGSYSVGPQIHIIDTWFRAAKIS
jgi:hypothetical protein